METKQIFTNFFNNLTDALNANNLTQLQNYASDDLKIKTNFTGDFEGNKALDRFAEKISNPLEFKSFQITNRHTSFDNDKVIQSGYIIGLLAANPINNLKYFQFGSHFIVRGNLHNNELKIHEFRIEIDWIDHNGLLPPNIETALNTLQLDPRILSELDSPWRLIPDYVRSMTDEEAIIDTYIKYAWSIDQQDFAQMLTTFTSDAKADMSPFGKMNGQREIVNKLKVLRDGQPYFQHSADKFKVKIIDKNHAEMKIYRNVPYRPTKENITQNNIYGNIYGAYYNTKLIKQDGQWRFSWMEYIPGWTTA